MVRWIEERRIRQVASAHDDEIISDQRISEDRRVFYAIALLGVLRTGEVSALRFRAYDPLLELLGRLLVAASFDTRTRLEKGVKTGKPREVPIHRTLAKVLAAWKLSGWPRMKGRSPGPDDVLVPKQDGPNRDAHFVLYWFRRDWPLMPSGRVRPRCRSVRCLGASSYLSSGSCFGRRSGARRGFQMKSVPVFWTIGLFSLLLGGVKAEADSGWVVQRPLPQPLTLHATKMLDANTIVSVGEGGTILRSTDAGITWIVSRPFGNDLFLNALSFADQNLGVAVGNFGAIVRTLDGGLTWQAEESGTTAHLKGVSIIDSGVGAAAGTEGTILRTNDGGANWVPQQSGTNLPLRSVALVDAEVATAVGYIYFEGDRRGIILRTTNGGDTWMIQASNGTYFPESVAFIDRDRGMIVGADRYAGTLMLRTQDGGARWSSVAPPDFRVWLFAVALAAPATAVAVNLFGGAVRTEDFGDTWQWISSAPGGYGVSFANADVGTSVGLYGAIGRSEDGGRSWTLQSSEMYSLRGVSMVDANTAIVVGQGTIIRTDDGGKNWRSLRSPPSCGYGDAVQFLDANTGTVIGADVCRTYDGGETWIAQHAPAGGLAAVSFSDVQHGWVISLQSILRTEDAGDTWFTQWRDNDNRFFLRAIFALDENTGIAVGEYVRGVQTSAILRTTDGGGSWQEQIIPNVSSLYGVSFAGNFGTAVGGAIGGGAILRSVDGGQTWERQESGTTASPLVAVSQVDPMIATAVGGGAILRTLDGGQTWHRQRLDFSAPVAAVSFADADNGMAVGEGGLILRTWSGGEE